MDDVWSKLQYFKKDGLDDWGNAEEMDAVLLLALDDLRRFVGTPIYVVQGNQGGHAENSYHYIRNGSCAVDIVLPKWTGNPIDLLFAVFRFPFTGVGWYPHWKTKFNSRGGLHLDTRPLKWDDDFTKNYTHSRWMGIRGDSGKQEYIELSYENITKYSVKE